MPTNTATKKKIELCVTASCNHAKSFHPKKDPAGVKRGECLVMGCKCQEWEAPASTA